MKKFLTALLFACSLTMVGAAIGCDDDPVDSSSGNSSSSSIGGNVQGETRTVTFTKGEGYSFNANVGADGKISEGNQLIFEVELGAFYTGSLVVSANGTPIDVSADGTYGVTVGKEDITITVEGVRKDVSNMAGSGTMQDAFVVSKPVDLLFIAEQVNSGKEAYCKGAYILANDIDCKGEELKVIGDYSTPQAVFSGSFACANDAQTGEIQRYTISNFTINSANSNYVGLFGAVFADMTVESSGLIYGIRLDNFTINAGVNGITAGNKTLSCGSLLGYGVGANLYLCDATNGTVNVTADTNYFSFVGGLVGYQQGFYDATYDMYYPTEISYAKVDVDVNIFDGVALYAGGITGFMTTNYPYGATAAVHNSYSLGSVNGGLRTGGVVGGLGQYTVVSNCYAAGDVGAISKQSATSDLITSEDYCHAYAGGIVGYAENDTIAHDCFFNGKLSAVAASKEGYEHEHSAIGGGDAAGTITVDAYEYIALNCIDKVDLADTEYFNKTIGWQTCNWIFTANELPVINYEAPTSTIQERLTVHYVNKSDSTALHVGTNAEASYTYFDTSIQSLNSYNAIGSFIASGSFPLYADADENGYRSYGYYFDEACTQKVPFSYMPMKGVTLYMAFANVNPLVELGECTMITNGSTKAMTLQFFADGTLTYSDGTTKESANYAYDGENVLILNARLARYFDGAIEIDPDDTTTFQDPNFDLFRYQTYNFLGTLTADGLELYDNTYFTKEAPLVVKKSAFLGEYYTVEGTTTTYYEFYGDKAIVEIVSDDNYSKKEYSLAVSGDILTLSNSTQTLTVSISSLNTYDAFKGNWVKSATINKIYNFDGMGNYTYSYIVYDRTMNGTTPSTSERFNGTYTVIDNSMQFVQDGVSYTASLNSDGFLEIVGNGTTQVYSASESYVGTWRYENFANKELNYTLTLEGIGEQGYGYASLITADGYERKFLYEVAETISGVSTPTIALYTINEGTALSKGELYGYAIYNLNTNVLQFTQPNNEIDTGYSTDTLYLNDDYYGDWISDIEGIESLHFDGKGLYPYLGMSGSVTVNGNASGKVNYSLDSALSGRFTYLGKTYTISYDENLKQVTVGLSASGSLERKDELAGVKFIDLEGNRYSFDGRSPLGEGTLTVAANNATYTYTASADGYHINDNNGGSVVKPNGANHYLLTLNGTQTQLYIENEFMGDWAINNQYTTFRIGPTDTNGKVKANYKGSDVELSYLDPVTLTFKYREASGMPVTYYVFVIPDETTKQKALVLSEFTNLAAGEYLICSKASELFGTWSWSRDEGKTTLKFDGVNSGFVNGCAELTLKLNHTEVTTNYFYRIRNGHILMWSSEQLAGRTWYFRLDLLNASEGTGKEIFTHVNGGEKVLLRTEVDGLYTTEAFAASGTDKYFFDYDLATNKSTILVNGTAKYTYIVKVYNTDNTVDIEITDIATSKKYEATLDYRNQEKVTFTIGNEI